MRTWRTGPESEKLPDQEARESFPDLAALGRFRKGNDTFK